MYITAMIIAIIIKYAHTYFLVCKGKIEWHVYLTVLQFEWVSSILCLRTLKPNAMVLKDNQEVSSPWESFPYTVNYHRT